MRADARHFMAALRALNVALAAADPARPSLAARPRRLLAAMERHGVSVERSRPAADALARFGFVPETIFDIGVDAGTPFLYDAFPNAHFVLVDPVAESAERVARRWHGRIDYRFECCAVGAETGEAVLTLPRRRRRTAISRASLQAFAPGYASEFDGFTERPVRVRTLDDLSDGLTGPFGVKIDTEGHELEVISGGAATLSQTVFVLAEVSLRPRFVGGYRFSELIAAMGAHGFEPLDLLTPLRADATDCDVLFARYDSPQFSVPG